MQIQPNYFVPERSSVEIPAELVGKTWLLPDICDDQWLWVDELAEPTFALRLCDGIATLLAAFNALPACSCALSSLAMIPLFFITVANLLSGARPENLPLGPTLASCFFWAAASYLLVKFYYEFYRNHYVRRNLSKLRRRGLVRRFVGLVFREGTFMQFDGLDDSIRSNLNRIFLGLLADLFCVGEIFSLLARRN